MRPFLRNITINSGTAAAPPAPPATFTDLYSIALDGTGDYASAPHNAALDIDYNTVFTILMWVYRTASDASLPMLFAKQTSSGATRVGPGAYLSPNHIEWQILSTAATRLYVLTNVGSVVPLNTWVLIGISGDGTGTAAGTKIYTQGVSRSFTTSQDNLGTNSSANSGIFTVGGSFNAWGAEFPGKIGDFARFNTVLSGAQHVEAYNSGTAIDLRTHSASANLVTPYYWMGDSDSGSTITDRVGTNNLTLLGNAFIENVHP